MDTKLTIEQILIGLRNSGLWNIRSDIMIPNLSYGLLPYEADFVAITKSGYMAEVEIKRSWPDFKNDFKKGHNHDAVQVYYFYYCVPESIKDKVLDFLTEKYADKIMKRPAVLVFDEKGRIKIARYSDGHHGWPYGRHPEKRKLFLEEILKVARLGQLRYWSLLEKSNKV